MNIITKTDTDVKKIWKEKKENNLLIADKLTRALYDKKRGFKVKNCSTQLIIQKCECGKHTRVKGANLCRDRLCPICSWRLSLKRYADMLKTLDNIDLNKYIPYFLTLTIRNCKPEEIGETILKMTKAWRRMLNRKLFLDSVKGWARSIETTFNEKAFTLHPHMHCILLIEKGTEAEKLFASYKAEKELREQWVHGLEIDYEAIINLKKVRNTKDGKEYEISKSVLETFKYCVKDKDLIDMPLSVFREVAKGLAGKRLVAYGGILKTAKADVIDDIIEEDIDIVCENCGSELIECVLYWSFGTKEYIEKNIWEVQTLQEQYGYK